MFAGDNENLQAVINAADVNSVNLLFVFQHEVGTNVEFNPNFIVVAENLSHSPGIKNGRDYLVQAKKFLKQTQIQYAYIDENLQ